ncbi:MAG: 50S ribosomal protein L30 [Candidatus Heimdallarchaeaceae archaeon]|jgi:large subunit ribosomal protein L30
MSQEEKPELLAVIRLRGTVNVHYKIHETLKFLNIRRSNYMTLIPSTPTYLGMLKKARDFITWGEINQEVLEHVLKKRGELEGREKLTDKYLKENTEYPTIKSFSKALLKGDAVIHDIPKLKKFFRLHPARKGYRAIKKGFAEGGDVGYRGKAINELVVRMA